MTIQLNSGKKVFFATGLIVIAGGILSLFYYSYAPNHLVNNIDDLDLHRENVDLVDISLQKMGNGKDTLFCMQDNSLIKGVKIFNWEQ